MNYLCVLGDKGDALRLDEKQHGGTKLKIKFEIQWFAVSHEKPDSKGLWLVFICRENPRRSGSLLFPDCPSKN